MENYSKSDLNFEYIADALLDPNSEAATFLLLRGIRREYRNRRWGRFAVLRKFGHSNLYFPPDYSPYFAYLSRSTFYCNIIFVA